MKAVSSWHASCVIKRICLCVCVPTAGLGQGEVKGVGACGAKEEKWGSGGWGQEPPKLRASYCCNPPLIKSPQRGLAARGPAIQAGSPGAPFSWDLEIETAPFLSLES